MYNCEKTIKKIAGACEIVAYILMVLATLVCILLAAAEILYLNEFVIWVVWGGALFLGGILLLAAPFIWGFGDIVGNTKRIAENTSKEIIKEKSPEIGTLVPPDNKTAIKSSAFSGDTGLTSITIPNSVTSIEDNAFRNRTELTSVTIGNGVKSIGSGAFYGCKGLTIITIPDSVKSIGSFALYDCAELKSIQFNGTKSQWNAISKCYSWNGATINYTVHCTDGDISKADS